jgi:hypothetical protein
MCWAGHVAHMGDRRDVFRVLVGKPEGKRPLKRSRRRWEYNIKMDLSGSRIWGGGGGGAWVELPRDGAGGGGGEERW